MNDFQDEYILNRQEYGSLFSYVVDERVNSIYYNGRSLWIEEGRENYPAKEIPEKEFINRFISLICNRSGKRIGATNPVLKISTGAITFVIVSDSISVNGPGFIIKKNKPTKRLTEEELCETGLCIKEDLKTIEDLVKAGRTILITGGRKKIRNDLIRYVTKFIGAGVRTVSIEKEIELKLATISPGKDVTEFEYEDESLKSVLETALLLEPGWIIIPDLENKDDEIVSGISGSGVSAIIGTGNGRKDLVSDVVIEIKEDKTNASSPCKINKIRY